MSAPRLLVIEGNTAEARARQVQFGGQAASEGYAQLLRELCPGALTDICYAADAGANLPDAGGLAGYDGVAITGSSLNIYNGGPEISQQVALLRTVFDTGLPVFGSCWGLQLIAVAAGGSVRRNPRGREVGFSRNIRLTAAGAAHDLFAGKAAVFEAMTVHLDEVERLPDGAVLLAGNTHSQVQAAEIRAGGSICWGVQYHPEYPFREMAAIFRRISPALVEEGFFADAQSEAAFIANLEHLETSPHDKPLTWRYGIGETLADSRARTRELENFLKRLVLPLRSRRGRG